MINLIQECSIRLCLLCDYEQDEVQVSSLSEFSLRAALLLHNRKMKSSGRHLSHKPPVSFYVITMDTFVLVVSICRLCSEGSCCLVCFSLWLKSSVSWWSMNMYCFWERMSGYGSGLMKKREKGCFAILFLCNCDWLLWTTFVFYLTPSWREIVEILWLFASVLLTYWKQNQSQMPVSLDLRFYYILIYFLFYFIKIW